MASRSLASSIEREIGDGHDFLCECWECNDDRDAQPLLSQRKEEPPPLPELPEEALLEVFRWLPRLDLLRGPRGVCTSWRQAALSPHLWKRQTLYLRWDFVASAETRAIVRLAPRLDSLTLNIHPGKDMLQALGHTMCAVRQLSLVWVNHFVLTPDTQRRILRRQVELGRLRSLALWVDAEAALDVLGEVLEAGLHDLDVRVESRHCQQQPVEAPSAPSTSKNSASLKTLRYYSVTQDPLLEHILDAHAATLESVALTSNEVSTGAVERLARCSRLRKAWVPAVRATSCLNHCPLLHDLTVGLRLTDCLPAMVPYFLQGAVQLTKLTFGDKETIALRLGPSVMDCALALASCGRGAVALLEELALFCTFQDAGVLGALPRLLRGLPRLHTLRLAQMPPADALDAVTPAVAPRLRLLSFEYYLACRTHCCVAPLYRMLLRNPRLHLAGVKACHQSGQNQVYDCFEEGRSRHGDATDRNCGLYAHAEGQCDLESQTEHSHSNFKWHYVGGHNSM